MVGVTVTADARALQRAADRIARLGVLAEGELLAQVGAVAEGAVRRRISETKTAPDGAAWAPWSDRYAAGRRNGKSLLQDEGGLLDSIAYRVRGATVEVGSNLVYAAVHQLGSEGGDGIPARPFLGLSDEDDADIESVVEDFLLAALR